MAEPVLIWGGGAIGGTMGAFWARAGVDVVLVDVAQDHVEACRTTGLDIEGPVDSFRVRVPAMTPIELEGRFSRIVLAVKAQHTAAAITQLTPHLADEGFVVSAQNGLNEIAIARHVGERRTIGSFVNFGADLLGPRPYPLREPWRDGGGRVGWGVTRTCGSDAYDVSLR